jgi:hypothetical protein
VIPIVTSILSLASLDCIDATLHRCVPGPVSALVTRFLEHLPSQVHLVISRPRHSHGSAVVLGRALAPVDSRSPLTARSWRGRMNPQTPSVGRGMGSALFHDRSGTCRPEMPKGLAQGIPERGQHGDA